MYKTGQTNEKADMHKRRTVAHLEISNMSVDNTGHPDTTYLYYSYVASVTLKGSLLPASYVCTHIHIHLYRYIYIYIYI